MTNNIFLLFLKYPQRAMVKTRLAGVLGDDLTYELYQCFLADIATMTGQINARTIISYSGPPDALFPDFPEIPCLRQQGNNIGERMYGAFLEVFSQGYSRCVLAGSDSPDLPASIVNDAFAALESVDVVLGPSTDGGYYLIGFNRGSLRLSLFHDMRWSTAHIFPETLRRIAGAGLEAALLPTWSDIDTYDDLKNFYERNISRSAVSQVMKFLAAKRIIAGN